LDDFVKVGNVDDFREGKGRLVHVRGTGVAVFRDRGRWRALQDSCPHMGASLADGKLDDGCVVCHWHEWRFDLETGQGDRRSWAKARTYEVKIDGDEVLVRVPEEAAPEESSRRSIEDDEDWIFWDAERYFKK
jgi:nitrite reductase (NADH) small subunit/3-phenylpropionate/trans-cinnamate dioxygenase ferredoxin subunit